MSGVGDDRSIRGGETHVDDRRRSAAREAMDSAMSPSYYMPVLRAKPSEFAALRAMDATQRARIIPLLELTPDWLVPKERGESEEPRRAVRPAEVVSKKTEQFASSVHTLASVPRVIVDISHCGGLKFSPCGIPLWTRLAEHWPRGERRIVPVVRVHWGTNVVTAAKALIDHLGGGACFRITVSDLIRSGGSREITTLLTRYELRPEDVDLVVDFETQPDALTYHALGEALPLLTRWRTYTVVSGVFPEDLRDFEPGRGMEERPRTEWVVWRNQVVTIANAREEGDAGGARKPVPPRVPAYGDFTTQHALYLPSPSTSGSVSARYTTDRTFVICRGHKANKEKGHTFDQFIGHARLLCSSSHFYGWPFSAGDQFIYERSQAAPVGPGNLALWRQASINHHIAVTLAQLASLDGTSTQARADAAQRAAEQPYPQVPRRAPRSGRTARRAASNARRRPPPEQ